ncbi:MAG: hypothetical protein RR654_08035 [Oscillospiraceae bacterium]
MKKLVELAKSLFSKIKISRGVVLGIIIAVILIILGAVAIFGGNNKPTTGTPPSVAQSAVSSTDKEMIEPMEEPPEASSVPVASSSQAQSIAASSSASSEAEPQTNSESASGEADTAQYEKSEALLLKELEHWDKLQMDPVAGDVKAHKTEISAIASEWDGLSQDMKDKFTKDHSAQSERLLQYLDILKKLA